MKVYLVGIGMGNPDTLTVQALHVIEKSDCLIGAKRMLDSIAGEKPRFFCCDANGIAGYLEQHLEYHAVAVLLSGDVGFYSGAKRLTEVLVNHDVELICGVSSVQYLCAKRQLSWEDAAFVSLHGRQQNLLAAVLQHKKTFVLTGGENTPASLCTLLTESGLGDTTVTVGERLSYPEEKITTASAKELANQSFAPLSAMLVENFSANRDYQTHGISDEEFIRADVPMTKQEIRHLAVEQLKIKEDDIVYDVGAGTGSVSIEIAKRCPGCKVYAIEKNPAAVELICQNIKRFSCHNVLVTPGQAPQALQELPAPDKVFIGGSSGELTDIFQTILNKNPKTEFVITAVSLETIAQVTQCIKNFRLQADITQISSARTRKLGSYHMFTGQNPVMIFSCRAE